MIEPPWEDQTVVEAAMDVACQVRDISPDDIRTTLARIPAARLHDLVLVLAAMVDIDRPLSELRRWAAPEFLRPDASVAHCPKGHPLIRGNLYRNGRDAHGRQRLQCATCRREQYRKRSAA